MKGVWTNQEYLIYELHGIRDALADMQHKEEVIATMRAALLAVLEPARAIDEVLEQVEAAIRGAA